MSNSLASLSEGVPGSSPSGFPAPFHRVCSHQPLLRHMATDKQNRPDCQDSAWAGKTFRTLQVLLWSSLPLQGSCVSSLPHTPEKQQLSASRHFQSQLSDSVFLHHRWEPKYRAAEYWTRVGAMLSLRVGCWESWQGVWRWRISMSLGCPSLWHRPVRNHFKGGRVYLGSWFQKLQFG